MQSEEFDNKAREAADHHHPAYDEKAWTNMEKLLDKHLPQKDDDRRRIIFPLFFLLLLGAAAWIFVNKPWQHNKQVAVQDKTTAQHASTGIPLKTETGEDKTIVTTTTGNNRPENSNIITNNNKEENKPLILAELKTPRQYNAVLRSTSGRKQGHTEEFVPDIIKEPGLNNNKTTSVKNNSVLITGKIAMIDRPENNSELLNNNKSLVIVNNAAHTTAAVPDKTVIEKTGDTQSINNTQKDPQQNETAVSRANPVAKKTKSSSKKSNSFFLTLSAGPDISAAGSDRLGTTKLLAGGGIGYTFHDKFTIRTGFYVARKIYTATPYEYHPPAVFWTYYPDLEQVNADCKVYEIPLSLSYNFSHSAKQNWFATAGISSYLMKQETYNYLYKNYSGQQLNHEVTFLNKNKHYFSVLTLSGGYQRNINKTFSLMVEPYAKIPLHGIGYGGVKLNSAGVLLSVGIKAFGSKKKSSIH